MSAPRKQKTARTGSGPATLQDALLRNLPPQNLDAEKAVLGGALVRGALLDKLGGELRDEDFYSPIHRAIWRAMVGLWRGAKPVDLVSVAAALTDAGELETVGGPVYLADLTGGAFLSAPCRHDHDQSGRSSPAPWNTRQLRHFRRLSQKENQAPPEKPGEPEC